jgi:hypothetical protein
MREDIPNRRSTAFRLCSAFNLVCCRCNCPEKPGGKFPTLILGDQGSLVTGGERRIVERRRGNQFAGGNGCSFHGSIDGGCCHGANEKVPVFCGGVSMQLEGGGQ